MRNLACSLPNLKKIRELIQCWWNVKDCSNKKKIPSN
jgi:hypothetical protein